MSFLLILFFGLISLFVLSPFPSCTVVPSGWPHPIPETERDFDQMATADVMIPSSSREGEATVTLETTPTPRERKIYSSQTAIPNATVTSRERKRHSTPILASKRYSSNPLPTTLTTETPPRPPFATPSSPSKRDSYISLHSVLSSPSLPIISSLNRQCRHDSDYARLLEETSRHSSEAWRGDELTRFPTFVRGKAPIPPPPPKKTKEGKKIWKGKGKKDCVLQ